MNIFKKYIVFGGIALLVVNFTSSAVENSEQKTKEEAVLKNNQEPDPNIYQKIEISGIFLDHFESDVLELEKEHFYILYRSHRSEVFSDTKTVENRAVGPCYGFTEICLTIL